jgi:hypothetical protein
MNAHVFAIKPGTALEPPSDSLVADFENANDVRLPPSFVALMRTSNGRVPLRPLVESPHGQRHVERFLCMLDDYKTPAGAYDIEVVMSQIFDRLSDDEEEIGNSIIPFAVLFAGDFVYLDFRENRDAPTVCIGFHEESIEFHPVVETIAPSFDAFLAMMHDGTSTELNTEKQGSRRFHATLPPSGRCRRYEPPTQPGPRIRPPRRGLRLAPRRRQPIGRRWPRRCSPRKRERRRRTRRNLIGRVERRCDPPLRRE